MEEASVSASPYSMRHLFAVLLTSCNPSEPLKLWDANKDFMTNDILYRMRQITRQMDTTFTPAMYNEALGHLEDFIYRICGHHLSDYGLPSVNSRTTSPSEGLLETSYNIPALENYVREKEPTLMDDQRQIYDRIITAVNNGDGSFLFIDAPGGTGKTYLINIALAKLRSERKVALAVASTGIADQLLANGRTAHSTFKIPLNLHTNETPTCNIKANSTTAELLRDCKAIFWDEATMIDKKALEALDRTLQDLRKSPTIFGGIFVILSGDFRQTLTIVHGGNRPKEVQACIRQSHLWHKVETYSLTTNMRVLRNNEANAELFCNFFG